MDEATYEQKRQEILTSMAGAPDWAIEAHLRNLINAAAFDARTRLRAEANDQRQKLITDADAFRAETRAQADEQRTAELARLDDLFYNKQITQQERSAGIAATNATRKAIYDQATALRNQQVNKAQAYAQSGSDYASQIYDDIRAGRAGPTQQFALPGELPPPLPREPYVPDTRSVAERQAEYAAKLQEDLKIFDEMANLPPIPVKQAPELTREYALSRSRVPREEALAEADRILGNYVLDDPVTAREGIADIAQLYGVSNTEQQVKGLYQKDGLNLEDYAVDPENVAQQRYLSELEATKGITAFQPTMPEFTFGQPAFQPTMPQFTFGQPPVQPSGLPQQVSPGLPGLLVPTEAPVLSPGLAAIGAARAAPPPLLVPTEAPVLSPQTAYIGGGVPVTAPVGMKEGGLASVAREVAAEGRRGDSVLVHMTPDEVAGLQALAQQHGTSLTINPETGMPEAFNLKKFARSILPVVTAVAAPYLAPLAGGSALAGAALAGGLAGAGTMLGGGSFNEGLKTGLMSFGTASLASGAMGTNPLGVGGESTFNLGNVFGGAPAQTQVGPGAGAVDVTGGDLTTDELIASSGRGELLASPAPTLPAPPPTVKPESTILGMSPSTAITAGVVGSGLVAGEQERKAFERMEAERKAEEERRRGLGLAAFNRSLGAVPVRSGGVVALAGGGMTYMEAGGTTGPTGVPRDVTGTGDGMSDSVPATIEGVQEARLADGEFVIPADVVADIGNGSSDAGSKKLYDMMDRIRKARHGTTEQPPEIDAEALMPA
jgi:hypothetical protein